jgi:hypothetical protein
MATASHQPAALPERQRRYRRLLVPEMWASLAIVVMWVAVLLDALFGPDFVSANGTGVTRIPSAIILALFAYLGTRAVAKYGFGQGPADAD